MTALVALVLKLLGVGFLIVAAVGVLRLADPFQRMHAATKAGTLGAGFVVLGTLVGQQAGDVTVIGALTILLLLLTVPVAGHLLGRAAYTSGTRMGLTGGDALDGVLTRQTAPPVERLAPGFAGWPRTEARSMEPGRAPGVRDTNEPVRLAPLAEVRMALIRGQEGHTFSRAASVAAAGETPITAHALIDTRVSERAEESAATRARMRKACAAAMETLQGHVAASGIDLAVRYEEGIPEDLLATDEPGRCLLVVPQEGWFHHDVEPVHSDTSWAPDGLLHLPITHAGPVLYAGAARDAGVAEVPNEVPGGITAGMPEPAAETEGGTLVVWDQGEAHLPALLDWALGAGLWPVATVRHVGSAGGGRRAEIARIAARHGVAVTAVAEPDASAEARAALLRGAAATIIATMPRPLRARWYGMAWTERLAPGFRGDILAMEAPD